LIEQGEREGEGGRERERYFLKKKKKEDVCLLSY
jgi:hypothetical protein